MSLRKIKTAVRLINQIEEAFHELSNLWYDEEVRPFMDDLKGYPFQQSFDEIDVTSWREDANFNFSKISDVKQEDWGRLMSRVRNVDLDLSDEVLNSEAYTNLMEATVTGNYQKIEAALNDFEIWYDNELVK
jgi:hypothetical protein